MILEAPLLRMPRGVASRLRLIAYRALGMRQGVCNRIEGGGRFRRLQQIQIGNYNAFTQGCWLWPEDSTYNGIRIRIGDRNYFNRNVMIDACGTVDIGSNNLFGPDVYITDSNHRFGRGLDPHKVPMDRGRVKIGNRCWIGAKAVILKGVELGDGCVVAAGAVVTRSFPADSVIGGVPAKQLTHHRQLSAVCGAHACTTLQHNE
jgi:acetyltransferase-like isoleucine patch superfamily enzyme